MTPTMSGQSGLASNDVSLRNELLSIPRMIRLLAEGSNIIVETAAKAGGVVCDKRLDIVAVYPSVSEAVKEENEV